MPPSEWLPPWLNDSVAPVLAVITICGGFLTLWYRPELKTETIGLMTVVAMYYFGSSKGSNDKTQVLAETARVAAAASVDSAKILAAAEIKEKEK